MELLMIYKISPYPSFPKRGRKWEFLLKGEKAKMPYAIMGKPFFHDTECL